MTSPAQQPRPSSQLIPEKPPHQIQGPSQPGSSSESDRTVEGEDESIGMKAIRAMLGWMTPYEQMAFLRRKREAKRWELFRDALMRRWSNLNVICGLIMGAVSTIVFADYPLSRASFMLGIISLLSSLIAIGFGVGLIYVLGDVRGTSIVLVDDRYPRLHLFALSIPEVWAFVSFGTFFADMSVIFWEADNKGWIVKAGVTLAAVAFLGHLVAFGFLFREQDTAAFLIPDEPVFPSDEQKTDIQEHEPRSREDSVSDTIIVKEASSKGKAKSLDGISRPRMPSRTMLSSQTLVDSPGASRSSFLTPPARASPVPALSSARPAGNTESWYATERLLAKPVQEEV